jgi:hypothetical protein
MPNPPSFDLEKAVAAWRDELARQPGFTPTDLRELEAHLRDGFAELRKNPIREEEAFLLARLRVGPLQPVATEFAKVSPHRLWAPRLFWLAFGLYAFQVWQTNMNTWLVEVSVESQFWFGFQAKNLVATVLPVLQDLLVYFPPVVLAAFWLVRGVPRFFAPLFSSRHSVFWLGLTMFLVPLAIRTIIVFVQAFSGHGWTITDPYASWAIGNFDHFQFNYPNGTNLEMALLNFVLPICLIAAMVWLAPRRAQAHDRALVA